MAPRHPVLRQPHPSRRRHRLVPGRIADDNAIDVELYEFARELTQGGPDLRRHAHRRAGAGELPHTDLVPFSARTESKKA